MSFNPVLMPPTAMPGVEIALCQHLVDVAELNYAVVKLEGGTRAQKRIAKSHLAELRQRLAATKQMRLN